MKISVSMIALNEARHIKRALSSCTFADEIVVVDGGSTDGTIEIVRSFEKARIIEHPWEGHFGKQRQISLEHCQGDWVVRLDADEVFSEEFERGIRALLESTRPEVVGYRVRKCNLVGNEHFYARNHDGFEDTPRIFRNLPGVRWVKHVHEIPVGLEGRIEDWDVYVVHYNIIDKERFKKKGLFYSKIPESGFESPEDLYFREYDIQPRPARSRVSVHVPPFVVRDQDDSSSPRIAIIRGPNLNPWEMQNYEPLDKDFDITAFTTRNPNFNIEEIKVPVVKLPSHPENPAYMVGLEFALFDSDLIYTADTTWTFSYQAILIKEKFNKPVVCLQWENIPFAYEEYEQMRLMKKKVREGADFFIAVTERAREALMLEGVSPERITVLPMGININRFKPDKSAALELREDLGIRPSEKVILFIGRVVWEKGIYDLIYAVKLALGDLKGSGIRVIITGRGPELQSVRERVEELGISDRFVFIESYPYHRIHQLFNMADIFVLPSISLRTWKEQLGMVLIEAMACATPVISTLSGSIPEVVGDAGLLVQPNDPHCLAHAMVDLLKNERMRLELGRKGRERVESKFSAEKISQKIGEVFNHVLKGYRRSEKNTVLEKPDPGDHVDDYYRQERRDVEALIPDQVGRVLDIGCGEGLLGKRLLEKGVREVVGVELVAHVCKKAEKNLSRVICGDIEEIEELPFEEGYFDCIVLADVLEHLKDPLSVLRKIRKYLDPSGVIVASIPNVRYLGVIRMLINGQWRYEDAGILDRTHLRFFAKRDIEDLFTNAGYVITGLTSNIDPEYHSLDPDSREITIDRLTIKDLTPEDLKDLFVLQYLVRARVSGVNLLTDDMESATKEDILEMKREIESHLRGHPGDLEALLKYARICLHSGELDKALESLDTILLFEPGHGRAKVLKKEILQLNNAS